MEAIETASLVIDAPARRVWIDSAPVALTETEFRLLQALADRPGLAVSSQDLYCEVWQTQWSNDLRALHVTLSRLRRKLGESRERPRFLHTVSGFGYRFEDAGRRPALQQEVRVSWNRHLTVTEVDPLVPVLGWEPIEIVGGFWSPLGFTRTQMRGLIQALIDVGELTSCGERAAFTKQGSAVVVEVESKIDVDGSGQFSGLTSMVRAVPGRAHQTTVSPMEPEDSRGAS